MKTIDILIIENLFLELDLPTHPLGDQLAPALYSQGGGIPYFRILFSIPGMADRILTLSAEIKECNLKYRNGEITSDSVNEVKQKREDIINDIKGAGLFINDDILDNIWDKLPGD